MKKLKMALVGCGDSGNVYASHALRNPEEMEIIAVVDCDPVALNVTGDKFFVLQERRFLHIDDFLSAQIECDSLINATMDPAHYAAEKSRKKVAL